MNLSAAELQALQAALPSMSAEDKLATLEMLERLEERMEIEAARSGLIDFAHAVYPNYDAGAHHKHMARLFKDIVEGRKSRVIINIAPRHGKSELTSYLLPAWFLGHKPDAKIIMATHTQALSEDFGRRVRNLIADPEYKRIFPETSLQTDSKSAGSWNTQQGGKYYAVGVGGALAGRGADLLVIDDPHALPLDTEVPTPSGFKTIGTLCVGDEVYGPDGRPTRVVAKSDVWHDRELYKLTTDDGEVVYCDAGHLWGYRSDTNLRKGKTRTATARELEQWGKANLPCLPRHAAVKYPHRELKVDPYVLGAWLGDGTTGLGRMTAHPDDAGFMRAQFEDAGYRVASLADPYSFGVRALAKDLREIGVLNNKHVPDEYMTASVAQRMALLQGLMDTDGTVTAAGQCSFQNTNKRLAESVRTLLHSLGVKAKLCVYFDSRDRHATRKPDYRVNFKLQDAARMPRKRERTYTPTDKRCRSFTVDRTPLRADVQCITVEREDGLFLVGRGYVVTHNSEQDIKTGTRLPFDTAFNWYQTGPRQRLMWGGAIILVMCMTGDTRVRMADGTEKLLRNVRPGDEVATYENGAITTSRIANHRSNGVDDVYRVQTKSGRILRANERHPFLVDRDGEREWVRLKDLKPGMLLVATKDVEDPRDHSAARGFATHAKHGLRTIGAILKRTASRWGTTASGKASSAANATSLSSLWDCALTTIKSSAPSTAKNLRRKHTEHGASSIATGSRSSSTRRWLRNATTDVMSAASSLLLRTLERIGVASCASTTAMLRGGSEGFFATTATLPSGTASRRTFSSARPRICDVTLDEIDSISFDCREEVFDVEVARTENFIANGVVSHNTRWSTFDLTARLLDYAAKNPDADQWEVVEFPAILPSGKALWPERWSLESLLRTKASIDPKYWTAQYMQEPSSDEAAIIGRADWRVWMKDKPPSCSYVIQCLDTAAETTNRSDFTSITTWGVFTNEAERDEHQIILLDRVNQRMQFPELKAKTLSQFQLWTPDAFIVEKKNSGTALYQELRFMGLPVQEYSPHRGSGDKVARLNAVADIVKSGKVWIPDTWWAREMIDQIAQFPNGDHDDDVDTTSMALMRFRQGGYLTLQTDDTLAEKGEFYGRRAAYY